MSNLRKKININSDGTELFTKTNPGNVQIYDGVNSDAFMRLRVSEPTGTFETQLQYGAAPLFWKTTLTGGGTTTHLPNESAISLDLGTASGDKVVRQTRQYMRYQPGKSQLILMSGVMGALKSNVRQRIGYFDDKNGLFFEQDGTTLKVVRRTFTSGSVVDNAVNQSNWNIDKLDGTGASGVTIDMSKNQIFTLDFEWLGVGRVRMGFIHEGKFLYCHEFLNNNVLSTVYMTTGNLPCRYEIENTGVTASSTTMKQVCTSVISEGGFESQRGLVFSAANGTTSIPVTARRPILSIRPKLTFNSIENRGHVIPEKFEAFANADVFIEVVHNGSLTTPSWVSASSDSITEYDVSSTGISGGNVIQTTYVAAGATVGGSFQDVLSKIVLTLDSTTVSDRVSIVATSFTGTANTVGNMTWRELY